MNYKLLAVVEACPSQQKSAMGALRFKVLWITGAIPLFFVLGSTLTGCSVSSAPPQTVTPVLPGNSATFHGVVNGGQQPVSGSIIQIYAVGTVSDGSAAKPLLTHLVTTSDGTGNASNANANAGNGYNSYPAGWFQVVDTNYCPSPSSQVYLTSTQGNPGLTPAANNASIALMAMLGSCGNLSSSTTIQVNELTTIGSLVPLAPYVTSTTNFGYNALTDSAAFLAAVALVSEYVNTGTGAVPGPNLPTGYYASSTEIDTLADALATCINSNGGSGSPCSQLFSLAAPAGGSAPTDTITATVNILKNPGVNIPSILSLATPSGPFQPILTTLPSTLTLAIVPLVATPTFSLAPGTYTTAQTVSISDATPSATINYTTDGSAPTVHSSQYTGAITVSSPLTLQAIATASNYHQSNTASSAYNITIVSSLWVSSTTGSDSNNGTQTSPFKTIGKCLSVAVSGSTCNLLAGIYGETIVPHANGVRIAGAGTSSVTVTTADPVANWQLVGSGVYSAAVTVPAATNLGTTWPGYDLFYAGVEVPQAQWPTPSTVPMHPNWSSMAAGSSETTSGSTTTGIIYDPNLPAFTLSPTTTIHIWSGTDPYTAYYGIPSVSNAGSVQYQAFGSGGTYFAQPGGLYYMTGAKEFLSANTWFYDAANGVLYWQPPAGVNPNNVDVRFKQRATVADLSGISGTVLSNVAFLGGGLVTNSSSSDNLLDTLSFSSMSTFNLAGLVPSSSANLYSVGVLLEGNGNILRNSIVSGNTLNGVTVLGTGHSVLNNLIEDVDSFGDYAAGIQVGNNNTSNILIQNNTVFNVGRSAVFFSLGSATGGPTVSNISIIYNHFYNTMLLSTDGATIYGCCGRETTGSTISYNWIHSEVSPFSITFPKNTTTEYPWAAFYWDNGSGGISFTNNVVWNSFPEIVINGSAASGSNDILVTDNTDPDNTYGCSATINKVSSASNFNFSYNQLYYNVYLNQVTQTGTTIVNNLPGQTGASGVTGVGCSLTGCSNGGSPPPFPASAPSSGVTSVCAHKAP